MSDGGWRPDPTGRHEFRWWDGGAWSDVVADGGVELSDPMWGSAPAQQTVHAPGPAPAGAHFPSADGGSRQAYAVMAILGIPLVAVVILVVVLFANGGDNDDEQSNRPPPREALIRGTDMPAEWTESEESFAPRDELICEPRPAPPEPPRESSVAFDRLDPSGAISHRIIEHSDADAAAEVLTEAVRQADACGTFRDEGESGGEPFEFSATSQLVTGPTFGDKTVWYSIQVTYTAPQESEHEVLVCLDRHGSVISSFTLSTAPPTSGADRAMVETLAQIASDRLEGSPK